MNATTCSGLLFFLLIPYAKRELCGAPHNSRDGATSVKRH